VFDTRAIDERLRCLPEPLRTTQNGAELVWLDPQPGRSYVIGADVAEGLSRGDDSAAVVLDSETGLQCAELLARWPVHRFAEELARLGRSYNDALVAIERNNHGHAVLYALAHTHAYPRIYRHHSADGSGKPGWPMNAQTKPQAINLVAHMLRDAPEVFCSARLLDQCRNFSHLDGGEMGARPGSGHDDLVIALAIALAVRAESAGMELRSVRFDTAG
jgi:hypothetical protein